MSAGISYERVVSVISKPPELRTDFEAVPLLPWFRKKSQLFKKIKTDFLKDITRNCRFLRKAPNEYIIRQGEKGDCFYIILGGQVSIYILNQEDNGLNDDQVEDEEEDNELTTEKEEEDADSMQPEIVKDRNQLGNFVCSLGSGEPFGEVALASVDCIRTAAVIADVYTDLVVVDRALYTRSVRDVLAKEFEEKTNFVQRNPLFSTWAPKYRKQLTMALYKEGYPYEATLVKQGEKVDNIYFILRGQVEIYMERCQHPQQYARLFKREEDSGDIRLPVKVDKQKVSELVKERKRACVSRPLKYCYLGINESIGDTEFLMDLDTYLQTSVCAEPTDVLVLERKHYDRLFVRRHPKTIEAMRSMLQIKLSTRKSVTCYNNLPLLDVLLQKLDDINTPQAEKSKKDDYLKSNTRRSWGPGNVFSAKRPHGVKGKHRLKSSLFWRGKQQKSSVGSTGAYHTEDTTIHPESPRRNRDTLWASEIVKYANDNSPRQEDRSQELSSLTNDFALELIQDEVPLESSENVVIADIVNKRLDDINSEESDLQNLEGRMRDWLSKSSGWTKGRTRAFSKVQQLRRSYSMNSDRLPKPANRVVVHKSRLRHSSSKSSSPTSTTATADCDEHVRSTDHLKILLNH